MVTDITTQISRMIQKQLSDDIERLIMTDYDGYVEHPHKFEIIHTEEFDSEGTKLYKYDFHDTDEDKTYHLLKFQISDLVTFDLHEGDS